MTTYLWELRKLRYQKRTMLGLFGVVAPSVIFAISLATQSHSPNDVAFGDQGAVQHPFGLLGSGGAPRPRPVTALAR